MALKVNLPKLYRRRGYRLLLLVVLIWPLLLFGSKDHRLGLFFVGLAGAGVAMFYLFLAKKLGAKTSSTEQPKNQS